MFFNNSLKSRLVFRFSQRLYGTPFSTSSAPIESQEIVRKGRANRRTASASKDLVVPHEFRDVFPDFLPLSKFEWRHPIREKVERLDMLKRRMNLDIPEFYVGTIMAVTCADPYAPKRTNRFVGICIERDQRGLMHTFTLRNVIDGIAVDVPYDMYNPLIQSIQVLRLEKRPDPHLLYLRDAPLEYSTFPFDLTSETLPPGAPVPINLTKVKLKPPPWSKNWHRQELYGIDDTWHMHTDRMKKRFYKSNKEHFAKYDIVGHYRESIPREDQQQLYEDILQFEEKNQSEIKRPPGRKATTVTAYFKKGSKPPAEISPPPKKSHDELK